MCGIAGIVSKMPLDSINIGSMTLRLSHRGPDAQNIYVFGNTALGHTRLSIIDLSDSANQPFHSADKRYSVVFNGEIYNFKEIKEELTTEHHRSFRTGSDTEVVIEAFAVWREGMAEKLNGMFALAIFDWQQQALYLFRDRVGKKPLFYFLSDDSFVFASEIKGLIQHPDVKKQLHVNKKVITTFLHLGYIPEPNTIYQNIFKFPSGHWGKIDSGLNFSMQCYWQLADHVSETAPGESDAKKKLKAILQESISDRLISDVPLGAFLSGGTDSSLISAMASKQTDRPLKTFSIGFKESKFDESKYARGVARHLGTDHTEYILSQRESIDILEQYLHHFDEPFADTSAIPTMLVSKLAKQKVTVVLTGDGGDELFQGYGSYTWANRLDNPLWKMGKYPLRKILELSGRSKWQRVAHMLEDVDDKNIRSHIFSQEQYFFSQDEIQNDLLVNSNDFNPFEYIDPDFKNINLTPGEKQSLFDFKFYLKDDLLVKVDRSSMYYAIECRCPLLDYRVVEFAYSLPASLKIKDGVSKWILKELLREYLPDHFVDRKKWGFSVPLSDWLKNDLNYLLNYLSEEQLSVTGLFNSKYVAQLVNRFKKGEDYLYNRIWTLIVIQKFLIEK